MVWLVIGSVIAVSLAVLAFGGGDDRDSDDNLTPTATGQSPVATVERGVVENTLDVDGTIVADPAVSAKAPADGVVNHYFVRAGAKVDKGAPLFQIRTEEIPEATGDEDDEPSEPVVRYLSVLAPADGRVGSWAIPLDDEVTKGAVVTAITPGTFTAQGSVTPLDQYRLLKRPNKATITIDGGPAPFTCTGLTLGDSATVTPGDDADSGEDEFSEGGESGSGATVSCTVPEKVTVFDGLSMRMAIDAGRADGVLVVPVTAVRGLVGDGSVWVVGGDGEQTERAVELGVSDGEVIEVTKGLDEGEQVMQYVPGSDSGDDAEYEGEYR